MWELENSDDGDSISIELDSDMDKSMKKDKS